MNERMSEEKVDELLRGEAFDALPEPSPELRERVLRIPLHEGLCKLAAVNEEMERVRGLSIPLEDEPGDGSQQEPDL